MTNTVKAIGLVIAGLAVGLLVSVVHKEAPQAPDFSGVYNQVIQQFAAGFNAGSSGQFSITSSGIVTAPYFVTSGSVNSTSTKTNTTLTASDIAAYSDIRFAMIPAPATGFTLTLPASSTLSSFISTTVGSQRGIVIENSATSTSGKNITLAGASGTKLIAASSTLVIDANVGAFVQCVRLASSDISCALTGI